MLTSGFYPKITLPTRICDTSSTIIDNIYSNEIDCNDNSGIFINHISDYQAIFTITYTKFSIEMQDQYVTMQTNDDASLNNFVIELRNMNITDSLNLMRHYIVKRRNPFQVYSLTMVKCYGIQFKSPTLLINIS